VLFLFMHNKLLNHALGFTLVELILVVAIIAILAVSSAPFVSRFLFTQNLESAQDKTVSSLRKAQAYAMDNKNDAAWGVCLAGTSLRLFRGTCASPTYQENFDVSDITVSGLSEISFSGATGRRGEPSGAATITLSNDVGTKTVSINNAGGITIN
jgi:prepilin-type N-terminal cleavage/methylation domain-containing protein